MEYGEFIPDHLNHVPIIPINPENVKILSTPREFYRELMKKIESAQHRITLTSLYIGDSGLEEDMINLIDKKVNVTENPVKCLILIDKNRGRRKPHSERNFQLTRIIHILTKYNRNPENFSVYFHNNGRIKNYHKYLLCKRVVELIGVMHMKVYIIDDSVIISGANLGATYFKNRQDRYYVFENEKILADLYNNVVCLFKKISFKLNKINRLEPCSREGILTDFISTCRDCKAKIKKSNRDFNTHVIPTFNIPDQLIHDDNDILDQILTNTNDYQMFFSTGYFNPTPSITYHLITRRHNSTLLIPSQEANGFYGARGLSKYAPIIYDSLLHAFLKQIPSNFYPKMSVYQYYRKNWTFHAKGLWLYKSNIQSDICITSIGSSNYGYRSNQRDIESQVYLFTKDKSLMQNIDKERLLLFNFAQNKIIRNNSSLINTTKCFTIISKYLKTLL
ncbi:hypothetical protein A3Q56_05753 [Intoshia linei]|uniref:CDP-diacylglycerol--glycerol-3-phosphate 3-phosphatidyltransferase n=1 Tax=Intoshia linei TaxID=1819745 RepID=A0A177AWW7_9BILA|nr:hypothetical protein A3Q56_05753 [Intoshia linei]